MIRILLAATVLLTALGSFAQAGEVRIDGFGFGCKTPDGRTLKPQFGDMDGVFYPEIAGNEEACVMAVKRRIATCHQHTRFLSPSDNEKYAGCLPFFRQQAEGCVAHFRGELPKCGASSAGGGQDSGGGGQAGRPARDPCAELHGQGWIQFCTQLPAAARDAVMKHMKLKQGPADGCGGRPELSYCMKP